MDIEQINAARSIVMTDNKEEAKTQGKEPTSQNCWGITSAVSQKYAEEMSDWAKKSLESNELSGKSEPRF